MVKNLILPLKLKNLKRREKFNFFKRDIVFVSNMKVYCETKLYYLKRSKRLNNQKEILNVINLFLQKGYSINETITLVKYRFGFSHWIYQFEQGDRFYEVLKRDKFDDDVLLIIDIAESSGELKTGIEKAIVLIDRKAKTQGEIVEMMKYPMLLAIILFFAIMFISTFLVPQFEKIFVSFGIEKNNFLICILTFLKVIPFVSIGIVIALLFMYNKYKKMNKTKRLNFWFKTKFTKKKFLGVYEQLFVTHVTNLLATGLKIEEVFGILESQKFNILLQKEAKKILLGLNEGKALYESITKSYYSKELIELIKDGELNQTLSYNLESYLLLSQSINKKKNEKLLMLIQPIFYGIFGLVIIMLYAMMFVPMFQIMDTL